MPRLNGCLNRTAPKPRFLIGHAPGTTPRTRCAANVTRDGPISPTNSAAASTSRRSASVRRSAWGHRTVGSVISRSAGEAQQFAASDLGNQAGRGEVDALVDDPLPFEEEDRNDRDAKRLARRGQSVELAEICSQQVKFDDHRVVRDVKSGIVVTLVRKRGSRREVVTH